MPDPGRAAEGPGQRGTEDKVIGPSWVDDSSDEDEFVIERSEDGVLGWAEIGSIPADTTLYADSGILPGTTYYCRVRARPGVGDSGATNVANATTTGGGIAAPSMPSDLTATGVSASRIRLEWRNNSNDETGFKIERFADALAGWAEVGRVEDNQLSFYNTGRSAATTPYRSARTAETATRLHNVPDTNTLARVWSDVSAATDDGPAGPGDGE